MQVGIHLSPVHDSGALQQQRAALFKYVDEHQDLYVQRLAEWISVQSVSSWPEKRREIKRMMEMAVKDIEKLGGTVELVDNGTQKLPSGEEIPLPPILLGCLGSDPAKKTVYLRSPGCPACSARGRLGHGAFHSGRKRR
ncbi:Metallopeptidase M20 [Xenotaenia resolanae]|uniref:Metallopeptidase M20 n=1 Tax=Xenotaenia resolanae TaxID=208358 RepID=A0ABV0WQC3_9TELE